MKLKFYSLLVTLVAFFSVSLPLWAQGPEMNKVYTVPMTITDNNSYLISGDYFLDVATSTVVTVSGFQWADLRKGAWSNDKYITASYGETKISYEFTGTEWNDAKSGNLYLNCNGDNSIVVTILNKDANYVEPTPGGGTVNPVDPDYEPDYTNQLDKDGDGKLEPCAEYPAFGALVDYNKYPQKTNLPTIYINTTTEVDFQNKTSEYYSATIVVVDKYGNMKQRNESVGFRGRGNSTWRSSKKKPWRLKFPEKTKFLAEQDANYKEINNYANAKSWTLLANDFDKSLIRNALTHELVDYINGVNNANNIPFVPAYRFVDLVLNGEYLGTYQASDQVQVDKNRVNIDDNGWFVEYTINNNGFVEEPFIKVGSSYVNIKNPEDKSVSGDPNFSGAIEDSKQTQNAIYGELKQTLNAFHTAITNKSGWRQYVDMKSLVDWVIAMDITGNYDGGIANDYLYKSSTENKLHFGPLWDLDLGYGNYDDSITGNATTEGKHFWKGNGHEYSGIAGSLDIMYDDPYFVKALYERWTQIYNKGEQPVSALESYLQGKVTDLKNLIKESRILNYTEAGHKESQWWTNKWTLSENGLGAKTYSNYDDAITTITSFITNHIAWLERDYAAKYEKLKCATLDPCGEGHTFDTYLLQSDGSYRKGCSVCETVVDPDEENIVYHQFTIYPESSKKQIKMATSWQPSAEKPNSIAVVEAKQNVVEQIEGYNIIAGKKNADGNLTCKDFRLTDGHPYYSENKFVATNATYSRSISNPVGTICLPYKMQTAENDDAKFYHLKDINSEQLTLTPIQPEIEGNASAYVPVVFIAKDGKTSLTVTGENVTVKKVSALEPYMYSDCEGWGIVGTMEKQVIEDVTQLVDAEGNKQYLYYFSGGKLWEATRGYTNNPFRAYFVSKTDIFEEGTVNNARMVMKIDDEVTGITELNHVDEKPVSISRQLIPLPVGQYRIGGKRVVITK